MSDPRNFDRLASTYRVLEYLAFGRDLERARFIHLDWLRDRSSILVLGDGDGRGLARLVRAAPQAHFDSVDASPAMLHRSARRIARGSGADRVTFRQADLLVAALPAAHYDAVVTFFLLDCFTAPQTSALLGRIQASLQPGALWLWADFTLPAGGYARLRARAWLAVLYAAFRRLTGIGARSLPPVESFFLENPYVPLAAASFQLGLVRSAAWRYSPSARSESERIRA